MISGIIYAIIVLPNKHVDTHGTAVSIGLLKTGLKLDWLGECFASSAATLMFGVLDVTYRLEINVCFLANLIRLN